MSVITTIVGGKNECNQILEGTDSRDITNPFTYQNQYGDLSLSVYNDFTISVGENHIVYARGNNRNCSMDPANRRFVFKTFTKVSILRKLQIDSAVCGLNYTLYLLSNPIEEGSYLIYVYGNGKISSSALLNTQGYKIISIYGGSQFSAAIDECGSIHIIDYSIIKNPEHFTHVTWLPESDLPVFVAFQSKTILALSARGYVYEYNMSDMNSTDYFHVVPDLLGIECKSISGINDHCLVVATNGQVFCRGSNRNNQLGIDEMFVNEFVEIETLRDKNISSVYCGAFHSFFVDDNGALYVCGTNKSGEALMKDSVIGQNITKPTLTSITKDVKFCIAGTNLSIVFLNAAPPYNSNKKIELRTPYPYPQLFYHDSNTLMERINEFEKTLIQRDSEIAILLKEITSYFTKCERLISVNENDLPDLDSVIEFQKTLANNDFFKNQLIIKVINKYINKVKKLKTKKSEENENEIKIENENENANKIDEEYDYDNDNENENGDADAENDNSNHNNNDDELSNNDNENINHNDNEGNNDEGDEVNNNDYDDNDNDYDDNDDDFDENE